MTKTYAAFYLPPEEKEVRVPNQKNVDRTTGLLLQAKNKAKQLFSVNTITEMARNIDLQSTTEFTQRYAVGALTKIINGEPVTNKTMLDSLFNTYAPALNAGLAQTGFNSIVEMKNAAQAGNGQINVANFVQGFSNGLSIVQSATERVNFSKYGEEVPIDVISECVYEYDRIIAKQKIVGKIDLSQYVGDLDPVTITIKAHVKNENAELWSVNDFSNKIIDLFMKEESIIFRAGKSIYENCIITSYQPTITNIYDISFTMTLSYNHKMNLQSQEGNGYRVIKPNPYNKELKNLCATEKYLGIHTGK